MMQWVMSIINLLVPLTALPSSLPIYHGQQLHIRYPGRDWIIPGTTLDVQDTKDIPEISSHQLDCHTRYMLLMVDPDGMLPGTATQAVVLHWYQPDLISNCTEQKHPPFLVPDDDTISDSVAPYIAPQPPPCSHHRYVYFIFKQPAAYRFPRCFSHLPPKTVDARAGFDMREFMHAAALEAPVAVNYFFARHNASVCPPGLSVTTTSFRSVVCDTVPTAW